MTPDGPRPATASDPRFPAIAARAVVGFALLIGAIAVHAHPNLLANPGFDSGLSGWSRYADRDATPDPEDGFGHPASGSARLTHDQAVTGNLIILQQCVPIAGPGTFRISGMTRNLPDQAVPGNASIVVQPARNADCTGGFGSPNGTATTTTTTWQYRETDFTISHEVVQWQAIMVSLAVGKAQAVATPRVALFDNIALRSLDGSSQPTIIFALRSGDGVGRVVSDPAGIDCPGTCFAGFEQGAVLRLDAIPQQGYVFTRWTGGPCIHSSNPACVFIVEESTTAGAEFTTQKTLSVLFEGLGQGRVTSDPAGVDCTANCLVQFPTGTTVSLTATAAPGSVFAGWSTQPFPGDCSGSAPNCTLAMTDGRIARPRFDLLPPVEHRLDVFLDGSGQGRVTSTPGFIDCPGTCAMDYLEGTEVILTATAQPGSVFDHWSGDCTGSSPSCTLLMDGARNAHAHFEAIPQHVLTVTLAGDGEGGVTGSPGNLDCPGACTETYEEGTEVVLLATAQPGSVFDHWSGDCTGTSPSCTLSMDAARSTQAHFATIPEYSLGVSLAGDGQGRVTGSPGGIDCPGNCAATYEEGADVVLLAAALPGSVFDHWNGDCGGDEAECVLGMDADRDATAHFTLAPQAQQLEVALDGPGTGQIASEPAGIDCPGSCAASFAFGTPITVFAQAQPGSVFSGWQDPNCSDSGTAPCLVTMDEARLVIGRFEPDPDAIFLDGFDEPGSARVLRPAD
jgi:hypothetical protein